MGFVANALDQVGSRGGRPQDDGVFPAGEKNPFFFLPAGLGEAHDRNLVLPDLFQSFERGAQLA